MQVPVLQARRRPMCFLWTQGPLHGAANHIRGIRLRRPHLKLQPTIWQLLILRLWLLQRPVTHELSVKNTAPGRGTARLSLPTLGPLPA
jgi:hypothetical protein